MSEPDGDFDEAAARAHREGWGYHQLQSGRNGARDVPDELTTLLLGIAADGDDRFTALRTQGAALSPFTEEGMEEMAPGSMAGAGRGGYTPEVEVADVDAEHERLQGLGVEFVKPPTTQPWGRRSVSFRDPDGNIINFYATV